MNSTRKVIIAIIVTFVIVAAIFLGIGSLNQPKEVPHENIPVQPEVKQTVALTPTVEPTPTQQCVKVSDSVVECTYIQRTHIVNNDDTIVKIEDGNAPIEATGNIDWKAAKRMLSKEYFGLWLGRNNPFWKGLGKEQVYQEFSGYVPNYNHGVIINSAEFDRLVISQGQRVYSYTNVFIGEEYTAEGIKAYASELVNPNDDMEYKKVFFYDKNNKPIASGYGKKRNIATEPNFNFGGDANNPSGSASGAGTSNGGPTGGSGGSGGSEESGTRGNGA